MGKKGVMKKSTQNTVTTRIKLEVKDEINDSDVHVARVRLNRALEELLHQSEEESSESSSEEEEDAPAEPYRSLRKTARTLLQSKKIKKRKPLPDPIVHTYVMKLFDRSVDLAQFTEDTPLYPICRAWLANQPRNPNLALKQRSPSPELADNQVDEPLENEDGEIRDINSLPPPLPREEAAPRNRIPSPVPQPKDKLDLNYDEQTLKTKEELMKAHSEHWQAVRKKWYNQAQKNEKRFYKSTNILSEVFKRAQGDYE